MDTPTLLAMPNEMLAQIFHDSALGTYELAQLRLTCKQLHDLVSHQYAERHISTLNVMMTRYSLRRLVKVCRHPIFGRYIQRIRFSVVRLAPTSLNSLVEDRHEEGLLADTDSPDTVSEVVQEVQDWITRHRDQEALDTPRQKKMIRKAFEALASHGVSPQILLTDDQDHCISLHGTTYCSNGETDLYWNDTLAILIEAANRSFCRVQGFGIETRNRDEEEVSIDEFVDTDDLRTFCHGLKSLRFIFNGFTDETSQAMLMVSHAKKIESLEISHPQDSLSYFDPWVTEDIAESVASDSLRKLVIHNIGISEETLDHLLSQNRDTFESLELVGCVLLSWLDRDDIWSEVIEWITKHLPNLQYLLMRDLNDEFYNCFSNTLEIKGHKNIQLVLKEYLKEYA